MRVHKLFEYDATGLLQVLARSAPITHSVRYVELLTRRHRRICCIAAPEAIPTLRECRAWQPGGSVVARRAQQAPGSHSAAVVVAALAIHIEAPNRPAILSTRNALDVPRAARISNELLGGRRQPRHTAGPLRTALVRPEHLLILLLPHGLELPAVCLARGRALRTKNTA